MQSRSTESDVLPSGPDKSTSQEASKRGSDEQREERWQIGKEGGKERALIMIVYTKIIEWKEKAVIKMFSVPSGWCHLTPPYR